MSAIGDQADESKLLEDKLASSETLLRQFAEELDDIERQRDYAAQRFIVERLVGLITVRTLPSERKIRRPYELNLRLT